MTRMFCAALAFVCVASIADARPRVRHNLLHPECNVTMPCEIAEPTMARRHTVASRSFETSVAVARRFIRGRLVCAINVNAELARRGIAGTGSAVAKLFLRWGRATAPVPGAVAVYHRGKRGGHVAIVSRVENGRVYVLNPSARRQRWVEIIYPKRAMAYRVSL